MLDSTVFVWDHNPTGTDSGTHICHTHAHGGENILQGILDDCAVNDYKTFRLFHHNLHTTQR